MHSNHELQYYDNCNVFEKKILVYVSNKIKVTVLYLINHFAVGYHFFFASVSLWLPTIRGQYLRLGPVGCCTAYTRLNKLNHLFSYLFECVHMVVTRSPTTKKDYNMYNKNTNRITIILGTRERHRCPEAGYNVFCTEKNV